MGTKQVHIAHPNNYSVDIRLTIRFGSTLAGRSQQYRDYKSKLRDEFFKDNDQSQRLPSGFAYADAFLQFLAATETHGGQRIAWLAGTAALEFVRTEPVVRRSRSSARIFKDVDSLE